MKKSEEDFDELLAAAVGQGYDDFLRATPGTELENWSPHGWARQFCVPLIKKLVIGREHERFRIIDEIFDPGSGSTPRRPH